jgi:hypothetical protein
MSSDSTVSSGTVEQFDSTQVVGWVESAAGADPVRVSLWADDVQVDGTYAVDPAHRHGDGDVRTFRFALADLWHFVGPQNRLTVRTGDNALPIAGHGTYVAPESAGEQRLDELSARLGAGEVFSRDGVLQLSKRLDTEWQTAALTLYGRLRELVHERFGFDLFLAYGTLLGAVREDGFIGNDLDFDGAFVSGAADGPGAARDLQQVAFALIDAGFAVRASATWLRVWHPEQEAVRFNLFHLYVDAEGTVRFPFGIAGTSELDGWPGTKEVDFGGARVLVPTDADAVLEHLYGAGWRSPNPGFSWARDTTSAATEAALPAAVIEEIYWADFYARTEYTSGSTFFELVNARPDLPDTVVDIGCGDGRDSFAFAAAGRTATGMDRSHVGVRHASRKADEMGFADRLSFTACDVGDAERLRTVLTAARRDDAPMVFYARFFLHSIPEDVQRTLMTTIEECAHPGDYFAAEFRTDKDEAIVKVHGNHYRRFQNGPAFGRSLRDTYGFTPLLEQEGNGFSPYKGEDPQLYRVIARRDA